MIKKKLRFHGHGSLNYLFKNGRGSRGRLMGIKFIRNPRRDHPRIAVIVSKKIYKAAVKRNRIRRRIFEIIRTHFDSNRGFDFTITVFSPEVLRLPSAELEREVLKLLAEIK
jgi:ribonuclease P protein component